VNKKYLREKEATGRVENKNSYTEKEYGQNLK
jgi:hypothetical protein